MGKPYLGMALFLAGCSAAPPTPSPSPFTPVAVASPVPTADELKRDLTVFASDSFRGRETGTVDERRAAGPQVQTLAAVLGIFGALDVPIVYMSNRWWRTQHPAPVFGGDADSGMKDPAMVGALMWNMLAWMCWGLLVLYFRYRTERESQKNAHQEQMEALEAKI